MATYDVEENEAQEIYEQIVSGDLDPQQFIDDSHDNGVYLDFEWMDEDDLWTDRKGGYDVTYEIIEDEPVDPELLKALEELKKEFDELIAGEAVDCFSCGELVKQDELLEMDSQYICPHCHEGWVEPDNRGEE
jgi:DNA-directed RNA polymerase subunit RPC12/RpoP